MVLQLSVLRRHSSPVHFTQLFSLFGLHAAFVQGCAGFGCCSPVYFRFVDDARGLYSEQYKSMVQARGDETGSRKKISNVHLVQANKWASQNGVHAAGPLDVIRRSVWLR